MTPRILRLAAIAIAVLAIVDPAITTERRIEPLVAVVPSSPEHGDAADRIAGALERSFSVVRGPLSAGGATVVVGESLPDDVAAIDHRVFAAFTDPVVSIERIAAPVRASVDSRVPVTARVRVARGSDTVRVALRVGGVTIDQVEIGPGNADSIVTASLVFTPSSAGPARLEIDARVSGRQAVAIADALVDIRERQWAVLFHDTRPSWMSTFVRRAVERDVRAVVTSRVVTSRGVATETGAPPSSLVDAGTLDAYDVIVIGAPERLGDRDVAGLEGFLRRRGGAVILLLDQTAERGVAVTRLIRAGNWAAVHTVAATPVEPGNMDDGWLRAARLVHPVRLPLLAEAVAVDSAEGRPVVWRAPVGRGVIVISGATDAWHARDPAASEFDEFWQGVVASAAAHAVPAVEVALSTVLARPGERVGVTVFSRDDALTSGGPAGAAPTIELGGNVLAVRADSVAGAFRAEGRAPSAHGIHAVRVAYRGRDYTTNVIVDSSVVRPAPDNRAAVSAWVASRGGATFDAGQPDELRSALHSALESGRRPVTWRPMRSPWWIVPFALALGGEWWWRRRRGLA